MHHFLGQRLGQVAAKVPDESRHDDKGLEWLVVERGAGGEVDEASEGHDGNGRVARQRQSQEGMEDASSE